MQAKCKVLFGFLIRNVKFYLQPHIFRIVHTGKPRDTVEYLGLKQNKTIFFTYIHFGSKLICLLKIKRYYLGFCLFPV